MKNIKVKDLLPHAWNSTDCIAVVDCDTSDQTPQYMAAKTAIEGFGDHIVDMFRVGDGLYSKSDKVLHIYVYKQ